jgi:hypothetical protein
MRLLAGGVDFAGSPLIFPGLDGGPFSNQASNARIKLACQSARVPVIVATDRLGGHQVAERLQRFEMLSHRTS